MSLGGCGSLDKASAIAMFEYQNLDYIETTIVQNAWLTPLATTRSVKGYYLVVEQTNNGATGETIELEQTVNGTIELWTFLCVSGTQYYLYFDINGVVAAVAAPQIRQMLSLDNDQSAPLETRDYQIRVRQTSAVDVVTAQIEVNLVYTTKEISSV